MVLPANQERVKEHEAGASARHIARVAARLFAARGYDATSVREIVEAAGVTKPTLYYHFGSKEGLAQALVSMPMDQLQATMRERMRTAPDAVAALAEMIQAKLDFCIEEPDWARFFHAMFFGPLATGLAHEVVHCAQAMDEILFEGIQRLIEAGVIEPERAGAFAVALHGVTIVSMIEFLYRDRPIGADLARRLVDDLLVGFGRGDRGASETEGVV